MRVTLFISLLLLLFLCVKAEDSYTACKCIRRRLHNKPCPHFVRHVVPQCAPGGDWKACQALCCASCRLYGDYWPICRSSMLRNFCRAHAAESEHDDDDDDNENDDDENDDDENDDDENDDDDNDDDNTSHDDRTGMIGPKMRRPGDMTSSEPLDVDSSDEPTQSPEEAMPSPFTTENMEPTPDAPKKEMPTRDKPHMKPTQPAPERHPPTAATDKNMTPSPEVDGSVEPPFDATNEGELDLTPATDGRPFAPAACACMSKGKACDNVLAKASGVCQAGVEASNQTGDCLFACCRICIVNMYATFCDDEPIRDACGL